MVCDSQRIICYLPRGEKFQKQSQKGYHVVSGSNLEKGVPS